MPRPAKMPQSLPLPQNRRLSPRPGGGTRPPVVLTVDEYEAIRLIDAEGFSQEQCSQSMEIARTTVQKIYESARKKLAAMLVEGRPLQIEGGAFRLCDGRGAPCGCPGCYKRQIGAQYQKPEGEQVMRIAIPYENGQVFQHFGHTQQFKIYDTDGGGRHRQPDRGHRGPGPRCAGRAAQRPAGGRAGVRRHQRGPKAPWRPRTSACTAACAAKPTLRPTPCWQACWSTTPPPTAPVTARTATAPVTVRVAAAAATARTAAAAAIAAGTNRTFFHPLTMRKTPRRWFFWAGRGVFCWPPCQPLCPVLFDGTPCAV